MEVKSSYEQFCLSFHLFHAWIGYKVGGDVSLSSLNKKLQNCLSAIFLQKEIGWTAVDYLEERLLHTRSFFFTIIFAHICIMAWPGSSFFFLLTMILHLPYYFASFLLLCFPFLFQDFYFALLFKGQRCVWMSLQMSLRFVCKTLFFYCTHQGPSHIPLCAVKWDFATKEAVERESDIVPGHKWTKQEQFFIVRMK